MARLNFLREAIEVEFRARVLEFFVGGLEAVELRDVAEDEVAEAEAQEEHAKFRTFKSKLGREQTSFKFFLPGAQS